MQRLYFETFATSIIVLCVEITDIKWKNISKHLLQRTQQFGGCTKPLGNNKLVQKILFPVITWNEIHSSKQVISMINILGKDLFAAATFKGL